MNRRSLATTLVAAAALTACSPTTGESAQSASPPNLVTTSTVTETHDMSDVMFARHMIPHHAQAIQMSDLLLAKEGIDQRVRDLAAQIKAAQQPEIDQMQSWLDQWGAQDMPMPSGDMDMPGHGGMSDMPGHGGMPGMGGGGGMMSDEDMGGLADAEGVAASRLFLTQMIEHHNGAITMAQNEIDSGQFSAAVAMARSIIVSQQQEIATMKAILPTL